MGYPIGNRSSGGKEENFRRGVIVYTYLGGGESREIVAY